MHIAGKKIAQIAFFTFLFLFFGQNLSAGRIEKAFENLEVYNLHDAEKRFRKSLKRHGAAASYGLALMYQNQNLPVFQKDSAYKYILFADSLLPLTKERRQRRYAKLNVTAKSIDSLKVEISTLFYLELDDEESPQKFQKFIDNHPWAAQAEEARRRRNSLAFQQALDADNYRAYASFIENYPEAEEVDMARAKYEERFFQAQTGTGTIDSYEKYIRENPNSIYVQQAHKQLYMLATSAKTVNAYINFLLDYENSPHRDEAWKELFLLRVKEYKPQELTAFKSDFPTYPFQNEIEEFLELAQDTLIPALKNSKYGFINAGGFWKIDPVYDWVEPFHEGKAAASLGGEAGFINLKGEAFIDFKYDDVFNFQNHLAVVESNGDLGLINYTGEVVLPATYKEIGYCNNNRIPVLYDSLYGYVNEKGEEVIAPQFPTAYDFENGRAKVRFNNGFSLIDTTGQLIVNDTFQAVFDVQYNLLRAVKNDKYGLLTLNGDTVLPFEYDKIGAFSNQLAVVAKGEKYYYVDTAGVQVFDEEFDFEPFIFNFADFENGRVKYYRKGKFGIMDTAGNRLFPAIFEDVGKYGNILTPVKKGQLWGYANQNVKLEIKYKFDLARAFVDSAAWVRQKGKWGVINLEGEFIVEPKYDEIDKLNNFYLAQHQELKGILTSGGSVILECIYDDIHVFKKNFITVEIDETTAVYNTSTGNFFYSEPQFQSKRAERLKQIRNDEE